VQILNALENVGSPGGWGNHPAVRMWRGHGDWFQAYGILVCAQWISLGYADTCLAKIASHKFFASARPSFIGNGAFHLSHRSNLLRKLPAHYGPLFPAGTPTDLPYWWPTEHE